MLSLARMQREIKKDDRTFGDQRGNDRREENYFGIIPGSSSKR